MDFTQNSVVGRGDNCDTEVMEILKLLEPAEKIIINIRSLSDISDTCIGTVILNGSPAWTFRFKYKNDKYLVVDINTGTKINGLNRLANSGHWSNELGKHRIILYKLVGDNYEEINIVDINSYHPMRTTWQVNDVIRYLTVHDVIESYQSESINKTKHQISELKKQREEIENKLCELHRELYKE